MADKLTSGDISVVTRQSDVTSLQHRTNYENLKNKVNEVIDDLAAVSIGTTNAETTAARPYHANLKARLDNITSGLPNFRATTTALVTESTPNAMTVEIAADSGQINGISVNWSAATSGTITAPSVNPRIDIVVANSDNTITIVTGAEAATPVIPAIATTQLALARIDLTTSTTVITNSEIINYGGLVNSQIGELIAIHPDTNSAYIPNSYNYSPCDGVELLDTTYIATTNDTKVPDLTDDRFLMGSTSYESDGTNNSNHIHNIFFRKLLVTGIVGFSMSTNITSDTYITGYVSTGATDPSSDLATGALLNDDANGLLTEASGASADEPYTTSGLQGPLGAGTQNRPLYFAVKYFIRIR
jgi:hypothetical protein